MTAAPNRIWGDAGPGALLALDKLAPIVDEFLQVADDSTWNRFRAFQWEQARISELTPAQRTAVEFITVVEDHLPNYFSDYNAAFPIAAGVDPETLLHNRLFYHFSVRWAQEEDRHAHVLREYQVRTGLADPAKLDRSLGEEICKHFTPDISSALELFVYTLLQEKATQLFYQQLRSAISEPVLRDVLSHLARDEARHFVFFFNVVGAYLETYGERCVPSLKSAAQRFKMPLHSTMKNYWRRSLIVRDAAGDYDHAQAFEALLRVIERFGDASSRSKVTDVRELLQAVHA